MLTELERLVQVEQRSKSNTHRIEGLEEQGKMLNNVATSVQLMAQNIERMTKEIAEQNKRLAALEREPIDRWNDMRRIILTTMLSTVVGGMLGAVLAVILK